MPIFSDLRIVTMTASAGGFVMPNTERVQTYKFLGSGTLATSYAITADLSNTLTAGKFAYVKVIYAGSWLLNGNSITVFGVPLTQDQALHGCSFDCNYDGSAWSVQEEGGFYARTFPSVQTINVSAGLNKTVNPNLDGKFIRLIGAGTLSGGVNVSFYGGVIRDGEEYEVRYQGTFVPNGYSVTLFGIQLSDSEVKSGLTTVRTFWDATNGIQVTEKISSYNSYYGEPEMLTTTVSFETNELGTVQFNVAYSCQLTQVQTCVQKTVAGTDNGTIAVYNGASQIAAITIPMSSAVGATTTTNISSGNTLSTSSVLSFVTSKTTNGGRVQCFLTFVRYVIYP